MSIQILDMAALASSDAKTLDQFCDTLLTCLSTQGFVKLVNHGMESTVDEAFNWNQKFFELSEETKTEIAHPPRANPNRGWTQIGQEKSSAITDYEKGETVVKQVRDVKESFDMGAPDDPMFDNMWPNDPRAEGFKSFMEDFYSRCNEVHLAILRSLEQALARRGIHAEIANKCVPNESELRLNYYPKMELKDLRTGKISRISEHTDFGTVTLLFQDSVGGLEIENQEESKRGEYFPIEAASKTEMLVNIGDSLQRLSNDYLTSVSHRVSAPVGTSGQAEGTLADRYSIAYFAKFNRQQSLKPMEQFVDEKHPQKYPDITAFELNQAKLQKIYG